MWWTFFAQLLWKKGEFWPKVKMSMGVGAGQKCHSPLRSYKPDHQAFVTRARPESSASKNNNALQVYCSHFYFYISIFNLGWALFKEKLELIIANLTIAEGGLPWGYTPIFSPCPPGLWGFGLHVLDIDANLVFLEVDLQISSPISDLELSTETSKARRTKTGRPIWLKIGIWPQGRQKDKSRPSDLSEIRYNSTIISGKSVYTRFRGLLTVAKMEKKSLNRNVLL